MNAFNPNLAAAIDASGIPLSADFAPVGPVPPSRLADALRMLRLLITPTPGDRCTVPPEAREQVREYLRMWVEEPLDLLRGELAAAGVVPLPSSWECGHGPSDDEPFCAEGQDEAHVCPTVRVHPADAEQFAALVERVHEAEQRPNRFRATPAEVDWFLRKILTEETLLNYQRAIGNRAVEEAAEEIRQETARLKAHGVLEPDKDWAAAAAADWIDTSKDGGHYPSRLLCARHDGFNPCPGAPRCTPRADEGAAS